MFCKFQCWRCDVESREGRKCSSCGVAYYCSDRCRHEDEFRHSSFCKDVAIRYECHGCRTKSTEMMKKCSNCMKYWFCGDDCMKKAWKSHKKECKLISKKTIELRSKIQVYYQHRRELPGMSMVYYWGNTPALDLLNLAMNEGLEYTEPLSLLLCGMGDPRNVCLTISRLVDTNHQGHVSFVLNDICACTLARTVLLLYMLCKGGESKAASITQIWYSLYLGNDDHQFLISALNDLVRISNLEVITHGIMKIDADQLVRLKNVWSTWLSLSGKPRDIAKQRRDVFGQDEKASEGMQYYFKEIPGKYRRSARDWFDNGVLLLERNREGLVNENVTLFGSPFQLESNIGSFRYIVPSDSLPFTCWDYKCVNAAYPEMKSLNEMYNKYITDVLAKCATRLHNDNTELSFILCDCVDIATFIPGGTTFDRITTSNLWDYIPLTKLLSLMKPLLNPNNRSAVAITESQNWIHHFPRLIQETKITLFDASPRSNFRKKILQDTGNKTIADTFGVAGFTDYYSVTDEFTIFVRASLLNTNQPEYTKPTSLLPSIKSLATDLKPRDFACYENKVAPFRWLLNCRRVNVLRGSELSLEWTHI